MHHATNTEWQLPEAVFIPSASPDDEHDMLETCRELQTNKYIEKNLCIKLDDYQEAIKDVGTFKHRETYLIAILRK